MPVRHSRNGRSQFKRPTKRSTKMHGPAGSNPLAPRYSRSRKRRGKQRKPKKVLVSTRQVKHWNEAYKLAKVDTGVHIKRTTRAGVFTVAFNKNLFEDQAKFTLTNLIAATDALRYFDPTTPGTLISTNQSSATGIEMQMEMDVYDKIIYVNNFQVPVWITTYVFTPKDATAITPNSAYLSGLADIGNPTSTNVRIYPSDSKDLTSLYHMKASKKTLLAPGASIRAFYRSKFKWNPSFTVEHSTPYKKDIGSHVFSARIQGVIGHENASDAGYLAGSVDWVNDIEITVTYGAGINHTFIESDVTLGTLTNAARTGLTNGADQGVYTV